MSEPIILRQPLACPDCAGSFDHIPRRSDHYKCPKCSQKWAWGLEFADAKPSISVKEATGPIQFYAKPESGE